MFNGNRTERQPLNDRRPKRAETVGKALPAGYTGCMVRMLYLRDIDVDVHVRCCACGHSGTLPRAMLERRFGPNYPVLSIAPHYRCSVCDSRDTESRPAPPETIEPMPAPAMEEAPSFDGPLAALRGLLDAARSGRPDGDEDEYEDEDENEDTAHGDKDGGDKDGDDGTDEESLLAPAFQPRFERSMEPPPRLPPVLSLDELAMDTGGEAEGRTPLWEPVSLADIASRLDRSAGRADPDQEDPEDEPDAWKPARRMSAPPDLWGDGPVEDPVDDLEDDREDRLKDRRDDDRERDFSSSHSDDRAGGRPDSRAGDSDLDETLVAMRQFFARDDAEADSAEPALSFPDDPDEEEDAVPPAFTSRTLARTDFEDDTADEETEEETDEEDPWDTADEDDDPSDEEILAFAIRDPERKDRREPPAEPAPKRPPPRPVEEMPIRSVRGSDGKDFEDHDASMEKTLAALRSMIEEAAAEPELPAGPDGPPAPPPSQRTSSAAGKDREEEDEAEDWRWDGDDRREKGQGGKDPDRDAPSFSVRRALKDDEPPEDPPASRRSSQELEIEQAMRSLRDLMESDAPPTAPPQPARPRRPSFGGDDRSSSGGGRDNDDFGFSAPPVTPPPNPPVLTSAGAASRRDGKGGEPSALDKTIAALRGMLELDGKRKK